MFSGTLTLNQLNKQAQLQSAPTYPLFVVLEPAKHNSLLVRF